MQFISRKRRAAPAVIIISLIDVLIVVLIFLMVTTTYKQQPAVPLELPESNRKRTGVNENTLVVTIARQAPLYLNKDPITLESLQARLKEAVTKNPQIILAISADKEAPFGQIIKVMDAAKAANIKSVQAYTKAN